jgi:hypothetical protein
MKLELKTPWGDVQLTVSDGVVGTVEVAPEGGVLFSLFPDAEPDLGEQEQPAFIGDPVDEPDNFYKSISSRDALFGE